MKKAIAKLYIGLCISLIVLFEVIICLIDPVDGMILLGISLLIFSKLFK